MPQSFRSWVPSGSLGNHFHASLSTLRSPRRWPIPTGWTACRPVSPPAPTRSARWLAAFSLQASPCTPERHRHRACGHHHGMPDVLPSRSAVSLPSFACMVPTALSRAASDNQRDVRFPVERPCRTPADHQHRGEMLEHRRMVAYSRRHRAGQGPANATSWRSSSLFSSWPRVRRTTAPPFLIGNQGHPSGVGVGSRSSETVRSDVRRPGFGWLCRPSRAGQGSLPARAPSRHSVSVTPERAVGSRG